MMDFKEFDLFFRAAFPEVPHERIELFRRMETLYTGWNAKINVISRKDIGCLYDHHVLHSLSIAYYLKTVRNEDYASWTGGDVSVLDLGTGGGFPGIPLAIMFPKIPFTLCDSIRKKTVVASEVARELGLDNVSVINARAETLPGKFDHVVSRAVASLTDFYPWVKGKYSKSILYLKGGDINEEINEMMSRFRMRKGSVSAWPTGSWLSDNYFEGKFVINIL